jgi:hypothetical protein
VPKAVFVHAELPGLPVCTAVTRPGDPPAGSGSGGRIAVADLVAWLWVKSGAVARADDSFEAVG